MTYDGIVIGGGPAGLFAAITAAQQGQKVILLERNDRLGKKLLITGKGRCNVTNHCSAQDVLQNVPRNGRFLYSVMAAFPPEKAMDYFESHGCPLKTERGNRVFPVSDRSQSVLDCLQNELRRLKVTVRTARVRQILTENGAAAGVRTDSGIITANWVILATGGLSYPTTGSTGDGYAMARELGHTVTDTEGSLVPLETAGEDCREMQGLSLRNVGVKLINEKNKVLYKDFGELLFTHFGVSGPLVLSASAHMRAPVPEYEMTIDLKPALDDATLDARLVSDLKKFAQRDFINALSDLLPQKLIEPVVAVSGIDPRKKAGAVTRQERHTLGFTLKHFPLTPLRFRPIDEAIVTSGGVEVSGIHTKTMMSKTVPGLFFAGEVIDVDAYTGGYNLQIAFATGAAAGQSAAEFAAAPERKD